MYPPVFAEGRNRLPRLHIEGVEPRPFGREDAAIVTILPVHDATLLARAAFFFVHGIGIKRPEMFARSRVQGGNLPGGCRGVKHAFDDKVVALIHGTITRLIRPGHL